MILSKKIQPEFILNSIFNGIIVIDLAGIIIYLNKTAEVIFDLPADKALNRYILDVLPNLGGKLLEALKNGVSFHGEKIIGDHMTLTSNITPITVHGEITGVLSIFQDVSEIERVSKELDTFKNMKNWLDTIIDSSYDGLWICDHEGKVIRINKASERINNVKAEEVLGKNAKDLVANGFFDKSVTVEVLKKKTSVTMIQQVRGGKRILITGNPIFDEKGGIKFVVINDRDMTELDELRSQLQEAQALASGYISKLMEFEMKGVDAFKLVSRSEKMQRIIETALQVSRVSSTVLLLGKSGVGKGMVAKLIHKTSNRSKGPFIRVDCAGIPESLIESELFGYEKGAFTGAKPEGKMGLLELANRGTLFLDEIGEVPLSFQSKLLRFLEDHEITRVGGTESRKTDVRIIAATNKEIDGMVSSKHFREDLYYRINVIPINIPPLSERKEDILPLTMHFLDQFNRSYGKKKEISPEVIEALLQYDFPGNIRELSNLIERFVVLSRIDQIGLQDLPHFLKKEALRINSLPFPSEETPLKDALKNLECLILKDALKKYGSQRKVAKALKVDHTTISRKIRKSPLGKIGAVLHHS
jgi:PAS domain S-box-containing protein/TyrR family helix-turn-helix protein